ncbi:MAG TPA: type III polyketide synthase [Gemmataceae bacterium]|nr:type III polyketide synthase [Gemmataceae bacterium]
MSLAIRGLGTALPHTRLVQGEAAQAAKLFCAEDDDQGRLLEVLYRQTEIETRHVVFQAEKVHAAVQGGQPDSVFMPNGRQDRGPTTSQRMERYNKEALPLAVEASRKALAESGLKPTDITHLVTVSCTGFAAPGVDVGLMTTLKLPPTAQRTNVGFMGCHGAINGLRAAAAYTGSDPHARVLVCAVELCSLHYYYGWNPKKMVGNALFGDGAAAVVGVPATDARPTDWRVVAGGSCLFDDSEHAMTWHVGDHGFDMVLSTKVPNLIARNLRPWVESWLGRNGLTIQDVGSWAVHPGGPRILTSVEETLGLPSGATDVSRRVLAAHGNMSSPTVLFILNELRKANAPRPCVAVGFGPGLVAEGLILR